MKQIVKALLLFNFSFLIFTCTQAQALRQRQQLTHADTLRGTYGPSRDWWNVLKYDLHVKFNIADSTISGYNVIQFKTLKKGDVMQIDLQEPMILDSVECNIALNQYTKNGIKVMTRMATVFTITEFKKDGNAYFLNISNDKQQTINSLKVYLLI